METFAAVRLEVDSWRWAGVPFSDSHGQMPAGDGNRSSRPTQGTTASTCSGRGKLLPLRVGPDLSLSIGARIKRPGPKLESMPTELSAVQDGPERRTRRLRAPAHRRHARRPTALRAPRRRRGSVGHRRSDSRTRNDARCTNTRRAPGARRKPTPWRPTSAVGTTRLPRPLRPRPLRSPNKDSSWQLDFGNCCSSAVAVCAQPEAFAVGYRFGWKRPRVARQKTPGRPQLQIAGQQALKNYFSITPQAILPPAFPVGSVL